MSKEKAADSAATEETGNAVEGAAETTEQAVATVDDAEAGEPVDGEAAGADVEEAAAEPSEDDGGFAGGGIGAYGRDPEQFEFVEPPVFEVDYQGDCAYSVGVTIPAVNREKKAAELFDELRGSAELPGFRKGRAPRKLLEIRFGKAVANDVAEKLITASIQEMVQKHDLRPIQPPDIDGLEDLAAQPLDQPLAFTLAFEVSPRCELGTYRGLEIERPVLKVEDANVDEAMAAYAERFSAYASVADVTAEVGDQVIIDFAGTIDGEAFQGGSADNYPYILGSGRFFDEFEQVLQGVSAGDETECDVAFPESYSNQALAGKTAHFRISVKEIKRKQPPTLDDAFAKEQGFDDMAGLRAKVAGDLQSGASKESDQIAETRALDQIIADSTFEMPKGLLVSTAEEYYKQEVRRLQATRVSMEDILAREDELREAATNIATRNIQAFVAVREIGEAEGIEVTEADFEREAEAIQERTGMDMEVVNRFLAQDEQQDEYRNRIFRQKAMAVVLETATITDVEVSRDELEKDAETDE